jgi:hypothetical protein
MQMLCSTFSVIINATHMTCTTTGFGCVPAAEQFEREAVMHACAQRSKVTRFPLLAPSAFLLKRKKYDQILFDQATCTEPSSRSNAIGEAYLLCTCVLGIVYMYDGLLLGRLGGLCLWITCTFIACICWCI